ncbi:MAG TPA: nitroreductase/quinone reductase family protein [Candidatus Binataceae bacterium]|nr:nitroreductase/quinone reductase family protein [Candidatus Binataceae bacterium]
MNRPDAFRRPNPVERIFNRVFGSLVGLGFGLRHNYLLQVRGRKSGKLYSAPIDLLVIDEKKYLVCPRGRSQWVRNAEASSRVTLKKGSSRQDYRVVPIGDEDKPMLLKEYLERFKTTVQRYFPVPAGSPSGSFRPVAKEYPVFELIAIGEE